MRVLKQALAAEVRPATATANGHHTYRKADLRIATQATARFKRACRQR